MILKDIMAESANYTGYVVFSFSEIKEINTVTVVNTFQHIIFFYIYIHVHVHKNRKQKKNLFIFLQSAFSHYANMSM